MGRCRSHIHYIVLYVIHFSPTSDKGEDRSTSELQSIFVRVFSTKFGDGFDFGNRTHSGINQKVLTGICQIRKRTVYTQDICGKQLEEVSTTLPGEGEKETVFRERSRPPR
jgi:hypothetical protein